MNKKLIYKLGAVLLALTISCSALSGCGKDKNAESAETSSSEGDTTVSKFSGEKSPSDSGGNTAASASPKNSSADKNGSYDTGSGGSDSDETNISVSALNDARSFFEAGMYDDAEEMLRSVDPELLDDDQLDLYNLLSDSLSNRNGAENKTKSEFTPEEAVKLVEDAYGVSLGTDTDGLAPQTDANGSQYYRMEVRIESENRKLIVDVHSDGTISEVSEEPIAYG